MNVTKEDVHDLMFALDYDYVKTKDADTKAWKEATARVTASANTHRISSFPIHLRELFITPNLAGWLDSPKKMYENRLKRVISLMLSDFSEDADKFPKEAAPLVQEIMQCVMKAHKKLNHGKKTFQSITWSIEDDGIHVVNVIVSAILKTRPKIDKKLSDEFMHVAVASYCTRGATFAKEYNKASGKKDDDEADLWNRMNKMHLIWVDKMLEACELVDIHHQDLEDLKTLKENTEAMIR